MSFLTRSFPSFIAAWAWLVRRRIVMALRILLMVLLALITAGLVWQRWYFARNFVRYERLLSLAWNPAGSVLAASYYDGSVFLLSYDADGLVSARCLLPPGYRDLGAPRSVWDTDRSKLVWSPDGTMLAGYLNGDIAVWDAWPEAVEKAAIAEVQPLRVIPSSWNTLSPPQKSPKNTKDAFAWSRQGSRLAVLSAATQEMAVYEPLLSDQPVGPRFKVAMSEWESNGFRNISWSPDDKSIVIPFSTEIQTLSLADGNVHVLRKRKFDEVSAMLWQNLFWSPDCKTFVLCESQNLGSEWGRRNRLGFTISSADKEDGTDMVLPNNAVFTRPEPLPYLCWSPDGKRIGCTVICGLLSVSGSFGNAYMNMVEHQDFNVMIWDSVTGKRLFDQQKSSTTSVLFGRLFRRFLWVYPVDISLHPGLEKFAEGENHLVPWLESESKVYSVVKIVRVP